MPIVLPNLQRSMKGMVRLPLRSEPIHRALTTARYRSTLHPGRPIRCPTRGGGGAMHVLFVHKEYPGHFGHVARHLAQREGYECTFVFSRVPDRFAQRQAAPGGDAGPAQITVSQSGVVGGVASPGQSDGGVRLIQYRARGASQATHPCSLHFEISIWHTHAVYETMKARPDIRPDLVVGHSGFGTALFLADLYECPLINYCEYYYRARNSDLDFRPEFPPQEVDILRVRAHNAPILLNLDAAAACYSPTEWQRSVFPVEYQPKIATIFDGIDRDFWYRRQVPRRIAGRPIPPAMKVVTYVSYGLEAMRGFDIFMKVAKRICDARRDVIFVVVGADRTYYGQDLKHIQARSFREHVLAQDQYDLSRFFFTGQVLEEQLVEILSLSDLHIYLTVPFVLSWSLMDALACGCTVLASDTAPVREMIEHEKNGLLAGFFDVEGLTREALRVLDDPQTFRPLGEAGVRLIDERYSMTRTMPRMIELYEATAGARR
jgi:glycosyltransferase involved in cell wall biosynthesis